MCGLTAATVKPMADVPAIDRSSTTERVADALREMLFAGDLSPGEPLREVSLADGFGVARSTVREALQVLAGEGLVTRYPNRGVVVTELTERDIAEIFEARLVLESAGVRAGAGGADLAPVDGGSGDVRRRRRRPTTRWRRRTPTWSSTPRWSRCSATPGWSPAPTP